MGAGDRRMYLEDYVYKIDWTDEKGQSKVTCITQEEDLRILNNLSPERLIFTIGKQGRVRLHTYSPIQQLRGALDGKLYLMQSGGARVPIHIDINSKISISKQIWDLLQTKPTPFEVFVTSLTPNYPL
jgi:hypothetical protein